jgi:hypothetical protein
VSSYRKARAARTNDYSTRLPFGQVIVMRYDNAEDNDPYIVDPNRLTPELTDTGGSGFDLKVHNDNLAEATVTFEVHCIYRTSPGDTINGQSENSTDREMTVTALGKQTGVQHSACNQAYELETTSIQIKVDPLHSW